MSSILLCRQLRPCPASRRGRDRCYWSKVYLASSRSLSSASFCHLPSLQLASVALSDFKGTVGKTLKLHPSSEIGDVVATAVTKVHPLLPGP